MMFNYYMSHWLNVSFCWVDGGRVVSIFPDLASPHEAVKSKEYGETHSFMCGT